MCMGDGGRYDLKFIYVMTYVITYMTGDWHIIYS